MVTKRPKVDGSEKWGLQCGEVKTFGEMCVLSMIYSYVAIRRFCVVCCLNIIGFSCYFLITQLTCFYFFCLFSILCILCCCTVLCTVSPFLYSCLFNIFEQFTDHCHRVEIQLQ